MHEYFIKQSAILARKKISVHVNGLAEKLENGLRKVQVDDSDEEELVDPLEEVKLEELLPTKMVRLDQLPRFQIQFAKMPQRV